jgi:hypothetical protein
MAFKSYSSAKVEPFLIFPFSRRHDVSIEAASTRVAAAASREGLLNRKPSMPPPSLTTARRCNSVVFKDNLI